MKIYDCFMYFDEDLLLDLRLNTLDKYVSKFVITEATYTHNGAKKKLKFDQSAPLPPLTLSLAPLLSNCHPTLPLST